MVFGSIQLADGFLMVCNSGRHSGGTPPARTSLGGTWVWLKVRVQDAKVSWFLLGLKVSGCFASKFHAAFADF